MVRAFNTTGSANMAAPLYPGDMPVMFATGDDTEATNAVLALARAIGFDAVDAVSASRELEQLAMIWIGLAYSLGNGPTLLCRFSGDDRIANTRRRPVAKIRAPAS